ncbi:hypothetical protein ACO2Q3_19340 [Caulobacter sp. KR2-114]|uniref:hypothetical protein n=1 Tax=Caulobacter sp. KR2-114 TaxID=3400912 RepID=UPI003C084893
MKIHSTLFAGVSLGLGLMAGAQAMAADAGNPPVTNIVNIDATVAAKCLFTGESPVSLHLGELATAVGNLDTSKVDNQSVTLNGWCNSAGSQMHVEATRLSLTPAIVPNPTGFVQQVDYTATAVANGHNATDDTSISGPGTDVNVGIFTGQVPVTLSNASAVGLLIAGSYQGTVTVTLSPG